MSQHHTLSAIADHLAVRLVGDGDVVISRVADLAAACPAEIAFCAGKKYQDLLKTTKASAVIVHEKQLPLCVTPALVTDNPYLLFARVAAFLHPDRDMLKAGAVSPLAVVADSAVVDATAHVAEGVVIEEDVVIGANTFIGPGCVIRKGAKIGSGSKLVANVTVLDDCEIGDRALIHPSTVIGSDGFGFARDTAGWVKIPQLGIVQVGDDVEIGSCVTIDRGALKNTVIEDGVKLDNQIHIAHNVIVGKNTAMAAMSGVAGSTTIGANCEIGGDVGILGHIEIAAGTRINPFSTVTHSIEEPGIYASGAPLEEVNRWRRSRARYKQLDAMAKRISALEKKLADLEKK